MNVLIIGSGGREHALGWKISQSPLLKHLFFAPGNPGTTLLGDNLDVQPGDFVAIRREVLENEIDLVVVGPEVPLVEGIHDFFLADINLQHVKVIGPAKSGARLEGSKDFAKGFMMRHKIPTARYASFTRDTLMKGYSFLEMLRPPYVLKADGLAAGKGVVIPDNLYEAKHLLGEMVNGKFGSAGDTVVIEEFLSGTELSVFVLTDGKDYLLLPEAKDYKRVGESNTGLNTGGMGAVSPVPFAGTEFMEKVEERIIRPTIRGIREEGMDYKGFIFFGLISCDGEPYVIEYNVRMGDPETEVVMPRIGCDFLDLLVAAANGNLGEKEMVTLGQTAAAVMLVSGGYPGEFVKGKVITGYDQVTDPILFHAGTKLEFGKLKTSGGRVMAVTGVGPTMKEALEVCYEGARTIEYEGKVYRSDIGFDL